VGQTAREARSGVVGAGMPPRSAPGVDSNVDSNVDSPKKSENLRDGVDSDQTPSSQTVQGRLHGAVQRCRQPPVNLGRPAVNVAEAASGPPPPERPPRSVGAHRSIAASSGRRSAATWPRPISAVVGRRPPAASTAEVTAGLPEQSSRSRTTPFDGGRPDGGVITSGAWWRHEAFDSPNRAASVDCRRSAVPLPSASQPGAPPMGSSGVSSCSHADGASTIESPARSMNALGEHRRSTATLTAGSGAL
jgi:hypothetical protein